MKNEEWKIEIKPHCCCLIAISSFNLPFFILNSSLLIILELAREVETDVLEVFLSHLKNVT